MRSWFVRHTDRLRVVSEAIDYLVDKQKLAIHYPVEETHSEDLTVLDPALYGEDGGVIERFIKMNQGGGYVWSQYRPTNRFPGLRILVGKIQPQSFEIYETRWSDRHRVAKLKTLQMIQARQLLPIEAKHLQVARPTGGTLSHWRKIGDGLVNLVERQPRDRTWSSLSDEEQNAVCLEYLRNPDSSDIPRLKYVRQIGGKMPDIDIFAQAIDGKRVHAYVSFSKKTELQEHVERLKPYKGNDSHVIVLCDCDKIHTSDGILFVPTKRVESWLSNRAEYQEFLFKD
jgi:hypothetical protein